VAIIIKTGGLFNPFEATGPFGAVNGKKQSTAKQWKNKGTLPFGVCLNALFFIIV